MPEDLKQNMPQPVKFEFKLNPEAKAKLIFLAVCFGLVFLIYGRSILGDFVFDDRAIVDHQALLTNLNSSDKILALPFWTEEAGLYRPVTLFSYALNILLFGFEPAGFHFINLILYALSGFLIYLLVEKLFRKKLLAYLSGIIFLLLPIHAEAVAYITGRGEILALLFSLLAFLEIIKNKPPAVGLKKYKNYWLAGLWLFLALGSKETAIAALPLAALIIYFRETTRGKNFLRPEVFFKNLPAAAWLLSGTAAYLALRLAVLGRLHFLGVETSLVENPLKFAAFWPRIFTSLKVLWLYTSKSFWPLNLCSDYSYNQIPIINNFFNWETLLGLTILLFSAAAVFLFLKRAPLLALGSAWFLFGYLPISNLFFPTGTIMGERLMYFPSVGLSFFLAYVLDAVFKLEPRKVFNYLAWGLLAGLAIGYSVIGFLRAGDWQTEERLFVSAAECAPSSVLSRSNLGAAYYLEGNLVQAKKELLAAQEIYGGYPKGINNLGLIYWKEGDNIKARELFLRALDNRFPYYGAYENLALVSLAEGKIDEARGWLGKLYGNDKMTIEEIINNYLMAAE